MLLSTADCCTPTEILTPVSACDVHQIPASLVVLRIQVQNAGLWQQKPAKTFSNQGARHESGTIRAVLGTTQNPAESEVGEGDHRGSRRDSGRSCQVRLCVAEAIRR